MKKLLFVLFIAGSFVFFACGSASQTEVAEEPATEEVVTEEVAEEGMLEEIEAEEVATEAKDGGSDDEKEEIEG